MSLLSSDIHKFIQFINLSQDKITTLYRSKLEITEWNIIIDYQNLLIIKKQIKNFYKNDNDFLDDINILATNDISDLYRTILKICDILDLDESKLEIAISKIFLGSPLFNNCGEAH